MSNKIQFKESELVSFIEDLVTEEKLKLNNSLLSESKERKIGIWIDRFTRRNTGKSPDTIFENYVNEIHRLDRNGITTDDLSLYLEKHERVISEQAFTMSQNQGVMGTIWETIREKLYRWALGFLGIKDGELKEILATSLGNIPFTQIPKLMNCDFLTPVLTKGILEYGVRRLNRQLTGMGGTVEQIFGNSLTNLGDNLEFYQDLEAQVRNFICGALGQKKDQVQDALDNVEGQKKQEFKGQDLSGGGEVPPETSGQQSSEGSGLSDIAQKYFQQFMQNLGR
jgi:hypothetical protein